jgi:soluble lytic murein transglycosylase
MRLPILALLLLPAAAWAQTADIAGAIRAADWPRAEADAATMADPVAAKLVTFYRLQHPDDATATEIAAFLAANPDWPDRAILLRRRDSALAAEPDASQVLTLCTATPTVPAPQSGPALARCADAATGAGHTDDAAAFARTAWVAGFPDADAEAAFLARWANTLTPADQQARFTALLAANSPAAADQAARLAPQDQPMAEARLALRSGAANAQDLIAALPKSRRTAPLLVLDEIRALQHANQDDAALALWNSQGYTAESQASAGTTALFWALRDQLARRRLRDGDNAGAFALADDGAQTNPAARGDAEFLAGFIALRRLHRPAVAAPLFRALAGSTSAITQARAHYWLARTAAETGNTAEAQAEYQAAAAWPTTFYGQLAALAGGADPSTLDARIITLQDPAWTSQQALDFAGRELPRAAALLVSWGERVHARPFLAAISTLADDPATRAMDAHFALGLGLPEQAVAAARTAGRFGTQLPDAGWPLAASPPDTALPPAVALGLIRQESSFDVGAVSPAGALGLMQLMPQTARMVGHQVGLKVDTGALAEDADINMRLGSEFLHQLIGRFAGSLPLAIAAYNAGPNRVDQWLAQNSDPRGAGQAAMIDWIELIPFNETRNYVQRVTENIEIYRAKRHEPLPYPLGA